MKAAGVTNALCVIQEAGNIGLEQRCAGVKQGLGGTVTNLQVDNNDPAGAQSTIKAKLQADKSINGVLTLGPGHRPRRPIPDVQGTSVKLATFDLNADVTKAIEAGNVLFAVDQQQYVQGYLPIVMLTLYKSNLNTIGGGHPVLTGPGSSRRTTPTQISKLAAAGTR